MNTRTECIIYLVKKKKINRVLYLANMLDNKFYLLNLVKVLSKKYSLSVLEPADGEEAL